MVYSSIAEEEIRQLIEYPIISDHPTTRYHTGKKYESIESFKEWLISQQQSDIKKISHSLCVYRENSEYITEDSLIIVNKLLGDTKILKKCVIIDDGRSFYTNRIVVRYDVDERKFLFKPEINLLYMQESYNYDDWNTMTEIHQEFNKLPPKEKINWMYTHFETIHIQMKLIRNKYGIYMSIPFLDAREYPWYRTRFPRMEAFYD